MRIGIPTVVYLVIGAFVAQAHHYYAHVNTFAQGVSAALATGLWPLVLLGVHFHVT